MGVGHSASAVSAQRLCPGSFQRETETQSSVQVCQRIGDSAQPGAWGTLTLNVSKGTLGAPLCCVTVPV